MMSKSFVDIGDLKKKIGTAIIASMAVGLCLYASPAAAQNSLSDETKAELAKLLAVPAGKLAVSCSDTKPPRNAVTTLERLLLWNEIALDTTAIDHTPNPSNPACFGEQIGPTRASYALAIVHIAMFDAVNAITKNGKTKFVSYTGIPPVTGNVSRDRAIAQAAHDTLIALYPGQSVRIEAIFAADIAKIQGTKDAINAGAALGTEAANAILALRKNDGSARPEPIWFKTYFPRGFPGVVPGIWQIDPVSKLQVALGAHWGRVKPFVMTSGNQFRPPPPPDLDDTAYVSAYKDVFSVGGDPAHGTATSRTAPQSVEAVFWGYDATPGLCAPPRLYDMIARTVALSQNFRNLLEFARYLALVNVAMADAAISSWEAKFFYQYWRPITGIRNNTNPNVTTDPAFYPLGAPATDTAGPNFTPPFPSYTSGHATIGGALFQILRHFFPDNTKFTFISDEFNGLNRDPSGALMPRIPVKFTSFTEAEFANAQSRIFLGIHWRFDAEQGILEGRQVGEFVFANSFQPSP